jgi:hypothetical protein
MAQDELDRRDGEALRLLLDANDGGMLRIDGFLHRDGHLIRWVQSERAYDPEPGKRRLRYVRVSGVGRTFAEAADAARAALTEATKP